jgi:hypothetical protein
VGDNGAYMYYSAARPARPSSAAGPPHGRATARGREGAGVAERGGAARCSAAAFAGMRGRQPRITTVRAGQLCGGTVGGGGGPPVVWVGSEKYVGRVGPECARAGARAVPHRRAGPGASGNSWYMSVHDLNLHIDRAHWAAPSPPLFSPTLPLFSPTGRRGGCGDHAALTRRAVRRGRLRLRRGRELPRCVRASSPPRGGRAAP